MQTIQLTVDCFLVKLFQFLNFEDPSKIDHWDVELLVRRYGDTCSLKAKLILLTVKALFVLLGVILISLFLGTGLWIDLYLIFVLQVNPFTFLNGQFFPEVTAIFVCMSFMGALGVFSVLTAYYVMSRKVIPWIGMRMSGKASMVSDVLHETSTWKSASKFYDAVKEKYCAKLEVDPVTYENYN